jgi:type II secretory pathway component PulK
VKFIRGTDRGNAVITALVLIMVLSSVTLSLIPRILSTKQFAHKYKTNVIHNIELSNMEIIKNYELD